MFQPSQYSDFRGDDSTDYEAMLKEYAPILRVGLEQVTDATRQQEVLRARISNLRDLRKRSPSLLRPAINRRIKIAKAKLKAAERKVGLQRETESAQRTYRMLTQAAIAGGVVISFAVAAFVIKRIKRKGT
jgi:intergrase/recombinase